MTLLLSDTDVHVWCVDTKAPVEDRFLDELSADERSRATSYHTAWQRSSYILTHFALRDLLARYVEVQPRALQFRYGICGKPTLVDGMQFNVSRSPGIALLCFARGPCGIDVARVEQGFHWQGIARHFLSSGERRSILEHRLESQPEAFFRCWTRREAYCKALGTGLDSLTRDCCSVDRFKDDQGRPWTLHSITRFMGCAAAVCVNSERIQLTYFDWESSSSVSAAESVVRSTRH